MNTRNKYNILLVEDNEDHVALIHRYIGKGTMYDYPITSTSTLEGAATQLGMSDFDVILLDLNLPDSSFSGTLERVITTNSQIPVIVMTGVDDLDFAMEMLHSGAQDYIVKGKISSDSLDRAIRYSVERKSLENRLQKVSDERNVRNQTLQTIIEERTKDLRKSERLYQTLLHHAPVGILLLNAEHEISYANDYFIKTFGVNGEVKMKSLKSIFDPNDYALLQKKLDATVANEVMQRRMQCAGVRGNSLSCNVKLVGLHGSRAGARQYLLLIEDISDKVKQEILEKEKLTAQAQNKAKTDFLATMSHEIRTPLAAITGYSGLLVDEPSHDSESAKQHVEAIQRNSEHLMSLVNDLLDLSKIEAGQLDVNLKEIDLKDEIEKVLSIVAPGAKSKGIELSAFAEEPMPATFESDPQKLRQILINLIGNAIKYTDAGSVRLKLKYVEDRRTLRFLVEDTGRGISDDVRKRLFTPFARSRDAEVIAKDGVGLGLTLAKSLTEILNGEVKLLKSDRTGSVFEMSLVLPVSDYKLEKLTLSGLSSSKRVQKTLRDKIGGKLEGRKVLIAEDVESIRELIVRYLAMTGAEVTACVNGKEALSMALQNDFDSVVLDLQMPLLSGYEVAQTLRRSGYEGPILALTAHALNQEKEEWINRGFDFFLTKPIDPETLIDSIAAGKVQRQGSSTGAAIKSVIVHDEAVLETIPLFVDHMKTAMVELEHFLEKNEWGEIAKSAHKLKGSAGSYGYPDLVNVAMGLEREAKSSQDLPKAESLLSRMRTLAVGIEVGLKDDGLV